MIGHNFFRWTKIIAIVSKTLSPKSMMWIAFLVFSTLQPSVAEFFTVPSIFAGQPSFPDLVVSSITNPPSSALVGTSFSVTDTTGNSGDTTANPSTTKYHLSSDSVITSADPFLTGTRSVSTLKKSSSSTGATTVTVPSSFTPGTYYLGACADDSAVITESNEANNCRASTTTITVTPPASITSLSPSSGPTGTPVTINGANFGQTQGSSTVTFNGNLATPTSWSATEITAPVPQGSGTGPVIVTVAGVPSNGVTYTITYAPRVNAGGNGFTDGTGKFWNADQSYNAIPPVLWGATAGSTFTTTDPIANTDDDVLYRSERFGNFGYKFDVPNGRYNVRLLFAEIFSTGPNQRLFNVLIEGSPVLTNYDIFAEVGHDGATSKMFPGILVQDAQLNIDFVTVVGNAKISAIEILPDTPAKLGISGVNGGNPPTAGTPFALVVQSQDSFAHPVNVSAATGVSVSRQSGTGDLTGTLTGTIPAGSSEITLSNISYSKAESGVIFRATRTSGDNLTLGDSAPFSVVASSPTKLGFVTQPANTSAGNALPGPAVIAIQDNLGNTVTSSAAQITIVIGSNPGGGTLSGTTQQNAVSGTGIFADLRIDQPGDGYTLTVSSPGLVGATSTPFNLTAAGNISGTVTRTGTGAAIGSASVEALQSGLVKRSVSTDGAGSYLMTGLPSGIYDVRTNASGYVSQSQTGVSVTAGNTTTANFSLSAGTPTAGIVYIYDELQRLKSVIDPVGEAGTYAYDPVGNVLSITRNTSSQTSVIDFSPNSGPVGGGVTIYGTGYSTTPSQNSVTFNGVAATVISSTLTQIVTTVPATATTGTIAVTTPAGGATSGAPFTVSGVPPGAPTITNVTPTVGAPGVAVTITGTNFDSIQANNQVRFAPALSTVTTSTTTSISTTVPAGARSGKISVSTAGGTAVSTQDFFVPPPGFTANDIEFTGRLAPGGSPLVMPVNTANKIAVALFEGVAGKKVSVKISDSTFPDAGAFSTSATLKIIKPDGQQLGSPYGWHSRNGSLGTAGTTSTNFLDSQTLPMTGTYTLIVDPAGSNTGQATITLYDIPAELQGTITPGGAALTAVTTIPGQNARFTFTGAQDQIVSVKLSNSTYPDLGSFTTSAILNLIKPDGSVLASVTWHSPNGSLYQAGTTSDNFLDAVKLTVAGTYIIQVDPDWTHIGQVTLNLYDVPADPQGSIVSGGAPVTAVTSVPGQNANLTFSGTAGQLTSALVNNSTYPDLGSFTTSATLSLLKPGGSQLGNMTWHTASGGLLDDQLLPVSGTYSLRVDPNWTHTGQATLSLNEIIPTDQGTISAVGAPVTVSVTAANQVVRLTFDGTLGDQMLLKMSSVTIPSSTAVTILKPDGTALTGTTVGNNGASLVTNALPTTGTYSILINPSGTNTGNMTLTLSYVMNLAMTYSGKVRDRVGQGDAALTGDGTLDGTFSVSLPVGSGGRTVTSLELRNNLGGIWDTQPNGSWALGAATGLDAALYNNANATVNFSVTDGGNFVIFGSDSGTSHFNSGSTFTLTVGFADGTIGKGNVTIP